jgi:hypothetical protein
MKFFALRFAFFLLALGGVTVATAPKAFAECDFANLEACRSACTPGGPHFDNCYYGCGYLFCTDEGQHMLNGSYKQESAQARENTQNNPVNP